MEALGLLLQSKLWVTKRSAGTTVRVEEMLSTPRVAVGYNARAETPLFSRLDITTSKPSSPRPPCVRKTSSPVPRDSGKEALPPPLFYGEKGGAFMSWVLDFNDYCDYHGISDVQKCLCAIRCFKKFAIYWLVKFQTERMKQGQGNINSWTELKVYLMNEFDGYEKHESLHKSDVCPARGDSPINSDMGFEHTAVGRDCVSHSLCEATRCVDNGCDSSEMSTMISLRETRRAQEFESEMCDGVAVGVDKGVQPFVSSVVSDPRAHQAPHTEDKSCSSQQPVSAANGTPETAVRCIFVEQQGRQSCVIAPQPFGSDLLGEKKLISGLNPDISMPELVCKNRQNSEGNSEILECCCKGLLPSIRLSKSAFVVLRYQRSCEATTGPSEEPQQEHGVTTDCEFVGSDLMRKQRPISGLKSEVSEPNVAASGLNVGAALHSKGLQQQYESSANCNAFGVELMNLDELSSGMQSEFSELVNPISVPFSILLILNWGREHDPQVAAGLSSFGNILWCIMKKKSEPQMLMLSIDICAMSIEHMVSQNQSLYRAKSAVVVHKFIEHNFELEYVQSNASSCIIPWLNYVREISGNGATNSSLNLGESYCQVMRLFEVYLLRETVENYTACGANDRNDLQRASDLKSVLKSDYLSQNAARNSEVTFQIPLCVEIANVGLNTPDLWCPKHGKCELEYGVPILSPCTAQKIDPWPNFVGEFSENMTAITCEAEPELPWLGSKSSGSVIKLRIPSVDSQNAFSESVNEELGMELPIPSTELPWPMSELRLPSSESAGRTFELLVVE